MLFAFAFRVDGEHRINNAAHPKKADHAADKDKCFKLPDHALRQAGLGEANAYKNKGAVANKLK